MLCQKNGEKQEKQEKTVLSFYYSYFFYSMLFFLFSIRFLLIISVDLFVFLCFSGFSLFYLKTTFNTTPSLPGTLMAMGVSA